jgi:hypothetical protein
MSKLTNFTALSTDLTAMNDPERTYLPTNVAGGRVRAACWGYESSAATTSGSSIALAIIPENAKILQIHYNHEDFGANAVLDLGLYTRDGVIISDQLFISEDDVSSAGSNTLYPSASATVGKDMYTTTSEVVLTATVTEGFADWAANKGFSGFVLYALNS